MPGIAGTVAAILETGGANRPSHPKRYPMNQHHHHEKGPGYMPLHGRCSRQINDHRLKVKVRRQERRKCREMIRSWLGDSPAGDSSD